MRDPLADVPGSIVRVELDRDHPLSEGVGRWCWFLVDYDDIVTEWSGSTAPVRFPRGPRNGFYVSGLAFGERHLFGTPAVIDEPARDGRVVLMPSDPFSNGHMEGSRKILWNAIFGPDSGGAPRLDPPSTSERSTEPGARRSTSRAGRWRSA